MITGPAAGKPAGPGDRGLVLVVGSVNEDVVLQVPRPPGPGETIFATGRQRRPGGKGANQAVAAARAGASVWLLAKVGDDRTGVRMTDDLRRAHVDTTLMTSVPGVATGAAYITVTPDGENAIVVDPGANMQLTPRDIEIRDADVARAAVLLAQLEVPVDTVSCAVQRAVAAGTRPVVTLAPAQPVPDELLSGLDPLLVNEHEASVLLGGPALTPAMQTRQPGNCSPGAPGPWSSPSGRTGRCSPTGTGPSGCPLRASSTSWTPPARETPSPVCWPPLSPARKPRSSMRCSRHWPRPLRQSSGRAPVEGARCRRSCD